MKKSDRLTSLDGLRGLFALVILVHNCCPVSRILDGIPLLPFLWNYGGIFGNAMFFLLSGYLMARRYRERIAAGEVEFGSYLWGRIRKWYPLYALTNGVALLTDVLRYGLSCIDLRRILMVALLQSDAGLDAVETYNRPAWFLCGLVVCYSVYYLLTRLDGKGRRYPWLMALAAAWGYTLVKMDWDFPFCYCLTGVAMMSFFAGALLESLPEPGKKQSKLWNLGCIAVLPAAFALMMVYGVEVICGDSRVAAAWVLCPMILHLALRCKPVSAVLSCAPMQYLGKRSMDIFVWHLVIYDLFSYFAAPDGAMGNLSRGQYLLCLGLILLWSAGSGRLTEHWRKRIAQ